MALARRNMASAMLTNRSNDLFLHKKQGGFALVITLLLMVSISTIGLLALMNASTETLITRNEKEQKIAFQLAEAGLNEAYARLHLATTNTYYLGEISGETNYRVAAWQKSFNQSSARANLCSGSAAACSYNVTIQYLMENSTDAFCKPAGTCTATDIVMFGQDYQFPSTLTNIATGYLPVYQITSEVTYGYTSVKLISYIAASSLNTRTKGAIDSNGNGASCSPTPQSPANAICTSGAATSTITGSNCATASCQSPDSSYNLNTQLGDTLANVKNMADERHYCSTNTCSAAGDDIGSSGAIDSMGINFGDAAGDTYSRIIYIDNDNDDDYNTASTAKAAILSGGFTGRGILLITGDLELRGSLSYEGLIYVMGTLTISGGGGDVKNVTGGIIAKDVVNINGGSVTVTYNQATLDEVARESGGSAVVRWSRQ